MRAGFALLTLIFLGACEPDRARLYIPGDPGKASESSPSPASSPGEKGAQSNADRRAAQVPTFDDEFAKLGYRRQWRGFPTLLPGGTIREFEILGDAVAAQDTKSLVTVLEASSGAQRWSDEAGGELTKFVGMVRLGNRLVVSTESQVLSYDAVTGNILDKQRIDRVVNTRPAVVGEILAYGTNNGEVIGHLARSGYRLWGATLSGSITRNPVPVGDDGTLGIVSDGGEVLFIQGTSGLGIGRNRMFGGSTAELAASDDALFVASTDQSLYAFNKLGGSQNWRIRTESPLRFAPTYHDGRVFCDLGPGRGLSAIDAQSGRVLWNNDKATGSVVALRNKRLVTFDGAGNATTLDATNGRTVESVNLGPITQLKPDKFVDGNLYALAPIGVIVKLLPR